MKTKIEVTALYPCGSKMVAVVAKVVESETKSHNGKSVFFQSSRKFGWAVGQTRNITATDLTGVEIYRLAGYKDLYFSEVAPNAVELSVEEQIANLEKELAAKKAALKTA